LTIIKPHNPYPNPDAYGRWVREVAPTLIANFFDGSDIGAQINNAMATIPNGGTVRILDGYYVISTQVIMSPNSTLLIGVGIIDCGLFNTGVPVILMQDNCTVEGTGNGSQIRESIQYTNLALVISDYKNWLPELDAAVDGNSNLAVRKLHFIPQAGGDEIVGQSGIIAFFNSHNTLVESCFFDNIHMYGVEVGGLSSDGYYGDRAIITNNVFEGLWSQNIGVVNATNVICDGNIFTGTQNVAVTYIDFEINASLDKMQMFSICNNIINIMPNVGSGDGYNDFIQPGAAINVTGDGDEGPTDNSSFFASNGAFGVISNNVINGGLYPFTPGTVIDGELRYYAEGYLTQGITILGCQNIEISNNVLYLVNDSPIYLSYARMCSVHNNRLINCGITESLAHTITLYGSSGNAIENNVISGMQGFYINSIPSIVEQDSGDGRPTDFNIFKGNILQRYPTDGTAGGDDSFNAGEDPYILTIGPNSRVYSTSIFGVEMDAAEIESVAQLRHLSMPGARGSTVVPPVVRVGGGLNQGDGGGALYTWNADGYGEDGLTIITPTRLYPAEGPGRWNRAPGVIHMTTARRDGYSFGSSVAGLEIYNTDDGYFQYWTGSSWSEVGSAGVSSITSSTGSILVSASTGAVVLNVNTGHANTWTGQQTFNSNSVTFGAGATATGAFNFDLSGSTGTFKTSTGASTFGGSSNSFTSEISPASDNTISNGDITHRWSTCFTPIIQDSTSVKLLSSHADDSGAVAAIVDTTSAWSTAGSKLFSIRNDGTEVLYVDTVTWGAVGIYSNSSENGIFNTTTGAIDSGLYINGANLFFFSGATQVMDFNWSVGLIPHVDLGIPLGGSANRWSQMWSEAYAGIHHNVSSSGAVSINTQLGEMCVLTSSASISGITLAAGLPAQLFTLEMVQGNTSYTWPTTIINTRLAGGVFAKSGTTGQVDTITFRYNTTNSTWDEVSRSLAIS
jgi:parallel beta-helix repeat protein